MASKKQMLLGAAFAGLFTASISFAAEGDPAAPTPAPEKKHHKHSPDDMGECHHANECKGKGECKGHGHDCAGKNECKGKGFVKMTRKECHTKKGKFVMHHDAAQKS
jgi:hypothetical protein